MKTRCAVIRFACHMQKTFAKCAIIKSWAVILSNMICLSKLETNFKFIVYYPRCFITY